jgi:hypothetical protein
MSQSEQYEVALSFAGEDRVYAESLANALDRRGIKTFFDSYEKAKLWGKNLYTHLADIYQNRAIYCVMLLSRNFAASLWTRHERESAQAGAFLKQEEYILPIRLDDCDIPGLLVTTAYIRWSDAETIADLIMAKLGKLPPRELLSFFKARQQVEEIANANNATGSLLKAATLKELYLKKHLYLPTDTERAVLFRSLLLQGTGRSHNGRGRKSDTATSYDTVAPLGWYWFSQMQKEEALTLIRQEAKCANLFVRVGAAMALGQLGETSDIHVLREMLSGENPNVMREAIMAIANLSSQIDIPLMRSFTRSKHAAVRMGAAYGIAKLGLDDDDMMLGTLAEDPNSDVRRSAINAMGIRLDIYPGFRSRVIPLLDQILANPKEVGPVSRAARNLLSKLNGEHCDDTLAFERAVSRMSSRHGLDGPFSNERRQKAFHLLSFTPNVSHEAAVRWIVLNDRDSIDALIATSGTTLQFRILQRFDYFLYCPKWWLEPRDSNTYDLVSTFR